MRGGKREPNVTLLKRRLGEGEFRLVPLTVGKGRAVNVVSESGLYKLIMRSDKDTARPFQDWVTGRPDGRCN
jgi:prophage antirepressor-like protein